jgi:hypothetical protein
MILESRPSFDIDQSSAKLEDIQWAYSAPTDLMGFRIAY